MAIGLEGERPGSEVEGAGASVYRNVVGLQLDVVPLEEAFMEWQAINGHALVLGAPGDVLTLLFALNAALAKCKISSPGAPTAFSSF